MLQDCTVEDLKGGRSHDDRPYGAHVSKRVGLPLGREGDGGEGTGGGRGVYVDVEGSGEVLPVMGGAGGGPGGGVLDPLVYEGQ